MPRASGRGRSDFALDPEQPVYRGGTHHVTFGSHRGRPAVFKYFVAERRWRNEAAALARWRGSGLVPEVTHEEPGRLIVMERLGGGDVLNVLTSAPSTPADRERLAAEIGAAFGRLGAFAPPAESGYDPFVDFSDWGWNRGLSEVARRCSHAGAKIVGTVSRGAEVLVASLVRIQECVPAVAAEPPLLFHEDASNLRVAGDRFVGFYGLELCRRGSRSLQLGAALNLCVGTGLPWGPLVAGYAASTGFRPTPADHRAALAMNGLFVWLRIALNVHDGKGHDGKGPAGAGWRRAAAAAEERADDLARTEAVIRPFL